jgi:mannose-6-phosphate isomerase-like protein (cupin superfamily)
MDKDLVALLKRLEPRAERWRHVLRSNGPIRDAVRIFLSADADAWLIAWPENHWTTPHDHGDSAGAVRVISGELCEYSSTTDDVRHLRPGDVMFVPRGAVHDVGTRGSVALSLHVYSPPLTAMNFYDVDTAART